MKIKIRIREIGEVLSFPSNVREFGKRTFKDLKWNGEETLKILRGVNATSSFRYNLLTPKFKLIEKIFQFNVQSQCGHFNLNQSGHTTYDVCWREEY